MHARSKRWAWIGHLRHDKAGVGAVEFALIVPVLLIVLLAGSELGIALTIDRKVKASAGFAVDLVSQSPSLSEGDLKKLFKISKGTIAPYSIAPLRMRVTQVKIDNESATIDWSCQTTGYDKLAKGTPVTVPENLKGMVGTARAHLLGRRARGVDYALRDGADPTLPHRADFSLRGNPNVHHATGESADGAILQLASFRPSPHGGSDRFDAERPPAPESEGGRRFSHIPDSKPPVTKPPQKDEPIYVLMGEASYDFKPVTGAVFNHVTVLSGKTFVLPRYSQSIDTQNGCSTFGLED